VVQELPRYEISNDGLVRVRADENRLPLYVMQPRWTKGSLCVFLLGADGRDKVRRIYRLMEQYWPKAWYPSGWQAPVYQPDPRKDRRFKITEVQRQEIMQSGLRPPQLAELYPLNERTIRHIKYGR